MRTIHFAAQNGTDVRLIVQTETSRGAAGMTKWGHPVTLSLVDVAVTEIEEFLGSTIWSDPRSKRARLLERWVVDARYDGKWSKYSKTLGAMKKEAGAFGAAVPVDVLENVEGAQAWINAAVLTAIVYSENQPAAGRAM